MLVRNCQKNGKMKHSEQFGQVCLYTAAQAYEKYKKDVINRKVSDVSEMFGISHLLSRGVENLRDGEKQRVALARAIVTDPAILLLDEPLSKLDAKMASSLGRECCICC